MEQKEKAKVSSMLNSGTRDMTILGLTILNAWSIDSVIDFVMEFGQTNTYPDERNWSDRFITRYILYLPSTSDFVNEYIIFDNFIAFLGRWIFFLKPNANIDNIGPYKHSILNLKSTE